MKSITVNNGFEVLSIEQLVKNSVVDKNVNTFDYKLNDKTAKAKLLKAAKRSPIEIEENSTSSNLVFSAGAWIHAVVPSVTYWNEVKSSKTCKIGDLEVEIGGVKENKEAQGKHVNTQIVFFANRNKIVCHLYNTTQLILINGHGYQRFIDVFLKPFLTAKINECIPEIEEFNDQVVKKLGPKTVRRSVVKLRRGAAYPCQNCDFTAKSVPALRRHKKDEHILTLDISDKLAIQMQSTRNNSMNERMMIEDASLMEISQEAPVTLTEEIHKFTCDPCDFATKSKDVIDTHIQKQHSSQENEEVKYLCTKCGKEFDDVEEYEKHDEIEHTIKQIDTDLSVLQNLVYITIAEKHAELSRKSEEQPDDDDLDLETNLIEDEESILSCEVCDLTFLDIGYLNQHKQAYHMSVQVNIVTEEQNTIVCDLCQYKCKYNIQLRKHLKSMHVMEQKYTCKVCDFSTDYVANTWKHMMNKHPDQSFEFQSEQNENDIIVKLAAEQNAEIIEKLDVLGGAIEQLSSIMTNIKSESDDKFSTLADAVMKMNNKISKFKVKPESNKQNPDVVKTTKTVQKSYASVVSSLPKPVEAPLTSSKSSSESPDSVVRRRPKQKSKFQSKPKMLYIGDSVGHSASLRKIEEFQNCRIKSERAYSSVFDKNARWPEFNFSDVVQSSLKKNGGDNPDILVMSAPTVDISNLDTSNLTPHHQTETFKKKTIQSSQNMFNIAEKALETAPNLKKVIIMEHSPRFDTPDVDPTSLKPNLVRLANATLAGLWFNSPLKDRIVIGHRSLESSGSGVTHYDRYQGRSGKYDGVHLYGRTGSLDYTNSVKTILSMAVGRYPELVQTERGTAQLEDSHTNCAQAQYQRRNSQYSVETRNRFSALNQGNY